MFLADSVNLEIDYSWVPDELGKFASGILGFMIIVSVVVFIIGCVKFVFTKLTATLIDNPNGIKVLIGVIIACVGLGSIGGLVAWGTNLWPGGITISF